MNAPQPPPTNPKIMKYGRPVMMLSGPRSQTVEDWVRMIAELTSTVGFTDWREVGGRAVVLTRGDRKQFERVLAACIKDFDVLIDWYMACEYNFTKRPRREDVQRKLYAYGEE